MKNLELLVVNLVRSNGIHSRKGTVLGKEDWGTLHDHLQEEVDEFVSAKSRSNKVEELADIFGIVVHAAVKMGFSLDMVEKLAIEKLNERFSIPSTETAGVKS